MSVKENQQLYFQTTVASKTIKAVGCGLTFYENQILIDK